MKLALKSFAGVREAVRSGEEILFVPESVETVIDLRFYIANRGG
ncbi:hypothetical protein [Noviherbaspirillum saxi]|nr:hypothetical protein [Noviherbaspirillum saxi]